ncbi:MAG: tatA [Friedmanniella sp.]|nr:tatA [Friedmanniella sp.]
MTPLIAGLGAPELLIILAVVLLLFGGSRLAGLGKSTGRALKEFKEETKGLKSDERTQTPPAAVGPEVTVLPQEQPGYAQQNPGYGQPPAPQGYPQQGGTPGAQPGYPQQPYQAPPQTGVTNPADGDRR